MKKEHLYVFILALVAIFGIYRWGYSSGVAAERQRSVTATQKQDEAIARANKKILDLQKRIGYNTDECFNRVWPDDVIKAVNELR